MLTLVASLLLASPAQAAQLKPTWSASSQAPADDAGNYDAGRLGDGKVSTAWFEGVDGGGLGEWAMADFGEEKTISSFTVYGGWGYSKTYWGHYNRPKTLNVEFSDGTTQEFTLTDAFGGQLVSLASPKKTSSMKFKLKASFASDAYNDTAISEIQIRDTAKDAAAPVRAITASSTFPADADGTYDGKNLTDGVADTLWCEGNKAGDGTGEWIEVALGSTTTIGHLALRNGNGASFGLYMKGNRATQVTLAFSDGGRETLAVKDLISEQNLSFPAHTTDKVRVSFDTVKKGTEFNDLCLSEIAFLP